MENEIHLFNFWAIELLDSLKVKNPSEEQIRRVENHLLELVTPRTFYWTVMNIQRFS